MAANFFDDEFDDKYEDDFDDKFGDESRRQTPSRQNAKRKWELPQRGESRNRLDRRRIDRNKTGRNRLGRVSLPHMVIPAGLEWYDCVMIPLLLLSTICILFNFPEVSFFFFQLTIWTIDIAFLLIIIVGLIFLCSLVFRRRRYYW